MREDFKVQSVAETLPLQVNSDEDAGEEVRLRYRYLDLREVGLMQISCCVRRLFSPFDSIWLNRALLNSKYHSDGFIPEGARDFLVQRGYIQGNFMLCLRLLNNSNSCWSLADRYFQIALFS